MTQNLLLIEDCQAEVLLIKDSLNKTLGENITIHTASSIKDASNILLKQPIDIIILDLFLNDSSGYDTIINLQKFSGSIPVVVFTGLNDAKVRYRSLITGIRGYLEKGNSESYKELAEIIITIIQHDATYRCKFADCPYYINVIKETLSELVKEVEDLKKKTDKLSHSIIGNGSIGYEERLRKIESFKSMTLKILWVIFPIILGAVITSIMAL